MTCFHYRSLAFYHVSGPSVCPFFYNDVAMRLTKKATDRPTSHHSFDVYSLLCGPISPVVNLEMSSTVRFYDGNAIYGCSGLGNCRMLNFLSGAFYVLCSWVLQLPSVSSNVEHACRFHVLFCFQSELFCSMTYFLPFSA